MVSERIKILQMLQEQKITVDEAERLLGALATLDEAESQPAHGPKHEAAYAHSMDTHPMDEEVAPEDEPAYRPRRKRKRSRQPRHESSSRGFRPLGFMGDMTDWAEGFASDMAGWAENFVPELIEDFDPFPHGIHPPMPPMPPCPPMPPRDPRSLRMRRVIRRNHGEHDQEGRRKRKRHFTPGWDIRASELADALRPLGYTELSEREIDQLRRHDVTPEYIQAVFAAGLTAATITELVDLRIYDIQPRYLRQMRDHFPEMEPRTICQFGVYNVPPEYVAEIRQRFPDIKNEEIIGLSNYDVDPAYIDELHAAGLTEVSLPHVIELWTYNLDVDTVKKAWDTDPDLTPHQILRDLYDSSAGAEADLEPDVVDDETGEG